MFRSLCVLLTLLVSLTGCATYPDLNQQQMERLPYRYENFDAVIAWEVRNYGNDLVIDGQFQNVRFAYMQDIEVWVSVLDADGRVRTKGVSFIIPETLRMDEMAPFSVRLPASVPPGTRLRFTYRYRATEGGSDGGGGGDIGIWMQNFETVVPPL